MDKIDQEHLFATFESLKSAVTQINQEINKISGIFKNYEEVKDHDINIPFNSPGAAVSQIKKLRINGENFKADKMCERLVNFLIFEVENSIRYYGLHESVLSPEDAEHEGYKWLNCVDADFKMRNKYVQRVTQIRREKAPLVNKEQHPEITDLPPGEPVEGVDYIKPPIPEPSPEPTTGESGFLIYNIYINIILLSLISSQSLSK